MRELKYSDIYDFDIKLIDIVLGEYESGYAWILFKKFYEDPDSYEKKTYSENSKIFCSADGLLSINRIKDHEGFGTDFKNTFEEYRRIPIIFFPAERCGINLQRKSIFKDRIDHTLFDLKNRLSKDKDKTDACKLAAAYNKPKTRKWLEEIKTFENYVDWLGLYGIFTDKDYNILDLEFNDETIITSYSDKYNSKWSEKYYTNLKKKIREYETRITGL